MANFVKSLPAIEIDGGLVRIIGETSETYWRPSLFRQFLGCGCREMAQFDEDTRGAIPFPEKKPG